MDRLTFEYGTAKIGSGPIVLLSAAFLASSSAFSFPSILECPGTHIRSTLLVEAI